MNIMTSAPTIEFVPFASTRAVRHGHVPANAQGTRIYEAEFREPHEAPVSLGFFTTRQGAELACARAHFPYSRGRFVVCERVLLGTL